MKRSNSVFNNFSENRFSSSTKKKYSSQNSLLDTHTEFANEFISQDNAENQCHEVRERNKIRSGGKRTHNSSGKRNIG